MARGSKSRSKQGSGKQAAKKAPLPVARVEGPDRTRAQIALWGGVALVAFSILYTAFLLGPTLRWWSYLLALGMPATGLAFAAYGASQLAPGKYDVVGDPRRWIYGGLAALFTIVYAICVIAVIPNRLPSAAVHLWSIPVGTLVMAVGTLAGRRFGWWLAVIGGSAILASTILVIARILASAAFLAGVYGAFGKAASSFAMVSIALIVEIVALLPICCVRWLMSRTGKRAYGVGQ